MPSNGMLCFIHDRLFSIRLTDVVAKCDAVKINCELN